MTLLITGGAGYIGSQTALVALDAGREVVVVDDLSGGDRAAVPPNAFFAEANAGDAKTMARLMRRRGVTEVIHFAASVKAPASMNAPLTYYGNNVGVTIGLLDACAAAGVSRLVFSSTAAVYGDGRSPARESDPARPVSPYGQSKRMAETILQDVTAATDLRAVVLRYFNVAGADPNGRTGQRCAEATHLVKMACEVAVGRRESLTIHGDDWPTVDGTGVRDFVHVDDIARAHLLALDRLSSPTALGRFSVFNLGAGRGCSVRQVVEAVGEHAGAAVSTAVGPRRAGDVAEMIADSALARDVLSWNPRFSLGDIANHALAWERGLPSRGVVIGATEAA